MVDDEDEEDEASDSYEEGGDLSGEVPSKDPHRGASKKENGDESDKANEFGHRRNKGLVIGGFRVEQL